MKQGKLYTKVILWLFLGAVVCYFGYYVFSAIYAPLTTATAMEYEAGSGSYTTGYVVREEQLVLSHYDITTLLVSEGERVAMGQSLATGYRSTDAQNRQSRIQELEHQLEQLEYAYSYSADAAGQAVLDNEIQLQLEDMNQYVARRDMNSAMDRSAAVKGLILHVLGGGQRRHVPADWGAEGGAGKPAGSLLRRYPHRGSGLQRLLLRQRGRI